MPQSSNFDAGCSLVVRMGQNQNFEDNYVVYCLKLVWSAKRLIYGSWSSSKMQHEYLMS